MKTTTSIKLEAKVKKEAQKLAADLGLTLSSVINATLKQFVKEKKLVLHKHPPLKPTIQHKFLKDMQNIKKGNMEDFVGPFTTIEEFKKSLLE